MTAASRGSRHAKKQARAKSGRPPSAVARVFWSGRSQAVRLPKEFRVDEQELVISRRGEALVLEPRKVRVDAKGWPIGFRRVFETPSDDFDLGRQDLRHERENPLEDE